MTPSGPDQGQRRRFAGRVRARRGLLALCAAVAALAATAAPALAAPDNLGTDFRLGFTRNFQGGATKTLFITGPTATSGTVTVPGLAFTQNFTVTPGTITSVELPVGAEMPAGEGLADVGVHVTSQDEVAIYGLSQITFTTDAFLGLPVDVLTGTYTVMAWGPGLGGVSEFGFVATEDNTTVTITPSINTAGGARGGDALRRHARRRADVPGGGGHRERGPDGHDAGLGEEDRGQRRAPVREHPHHLVRRRATTSTSSCRRTTPGGPRS